VTNHIPIKHTEAHIKPALLKFFRGYWGIGFAVLSPDIVASGEGVFGAQTALSARNWRRERNARTRLSAPLWLRLGCAVPLR
jgi:hypothetical protein